MSAVPKKTADQAKRQLERLRDLAVYGLTADQANRPDAAEWYRTILRAASDIREESRSLERTLSDEALESKCLSPTEVSRAAKVSTAALY
ncbi:hypothetical protein ACFVFH_35645, partial [Streptomyces sp. NPDC057697]